MLNMLSISTHECVCTSWPSAVIVCGSAVILQNSLDEASPSVRTSKHVATPHSLGCGDVRARGVSPESSSVLRLACECCKQGKFKLHSHVRQRSSWVRDACY